MHGYEKAQYLGAFQIMKDIEKETIELIELRMIRDAEAIIFYNL